MFTGLPMPGNPLDAFIKGFGFDKNLMQEILQRKTLEETKRQHEADLALRKAQFARAGANADLQRQLLQQHLIAAQHANDPNYEFKQFQALQNMIMGNGNPQGMPDQQSVPTQEMGQGMGMFSPEGIQEAQQAPPQMPISAPKAQGGMNYDALRQNPMLRGFFKHKFGFDPLAAAPETPEQKRALDLQSKIELENRKTANKAQAIQDKEVLAVKKDLPTLEKSLKGVNELLNIAKNNPDMFGHAFLPDIYAKTSKNKEFGKWQNLLSDAIAGLESKLSSRGNIVALKMAAQLKPSHAEQQNVAIGKLESMKQQLEDAVNHSRQVTGQRTTSNQYQDNDLVVVEGPNGEETMTYAQARALGAE